MRIITGIRKGMKLENAEGVNTRPTESRIKESIFNILGNVHDTRVLDLFSGSGAIGLEFLSRGAKSVVLVENGKESLVALKNNVSKFKGEGISVLNSDYLVALKKLNDQNCIFDYIYVDPPYENLQYYEKALEFIHQNKILEDNGMLIIEAKEGININNLNLYDIIDSRKYRSTMVYFLRRMTD